MNEAKNKELKLEKLLNEIENELLEIFGENLKKIILYGSYARETSDKGSDIDIMVLVSMSDKEIDKTRHKVLDMIVEYSIRYGVVLSIIEHNYHHFYEWIDVIPFYKNVENEGIELYAG